MQIIASPHQKLYLDEEAKQNTQLKNSFKSGSGYGLIALDHFNFTDETFLYWQKFSQLYLHYFSTQPHLHELNLNEIKILLPQNDLQNILATKPLFTGSEYVNEEYILFLWNEIATAFLKNIKNSQQNITEFFTTNYPKYNLLGRVCFHLAETKNSETPFAFLATYERKDDRTTKHLPLQMALTEYAKQKNILLHLLEPIHKASLESKFLQEMVDTKDIYNTLAWETNQAYQFLKDVPTFEKSGIGVKIPNWWKTKQSPKLTVKLVRKKILKLD